MAQKIPGGSGTAMFVKTAGQDRDTLQILRSGEKLRRISAHKAMGEEWRERVRQEEEEFDAISTGRKTVTVEAPPIMGEPHLWEALKKANNAAQVRRICRRSKYWLKWEFEGEINGKHFYSRVPSYCPKALYDKAEKFCEAKLSDRYPGSSERPSSDDKRIEYLARVMAGLSLKSPIAPATAVDVLRKMKHTEQCLCWRCIAVGKPSKR